MIEITDWEIPELKWFQNRNETQLLHYFEPEPGIFIAESPNVILRALEAGYEPLCILTESKAPGKMEKQVLERCSGIPVYAATQEMLTQLTGFHLTRGILCALRRRALPSPSDLCSGFGDRRHSSDLWMQRSSLPKGSQGEHGDGFPGAVDHTGKGKMAGSGAWDPAGDGI